jgi:general stress protein 26
MTTDKHRKLQDLLLEFDHAMFVTRAADGQLRSRPMVLADVEAEGTLWFLTQRESGKIDEIAGDQHVNVSLQSSFKFVSISGTARAVNDRHKISELWNEAWKVWFPDGKDDPSLTLIEVRGNTGEYWDNSGTSGIKYLIEAGKAYLSGHRPEVDKDSQVHAKVDL